MQREK